MKKCNNGLLLAAETLDDLLRGKYDICDWEMVLGDKIWNLPEAGSDIMGTLKISYYFLKDALHFVRYSLKTTN